MDFGDISEVLRSATDLLDTTGDFLRFVREAKAQWRHARTGESHAAALRPGWGAGYSGPVSYRSAGPSLAVEVRRAAAANGDPWVPDTTAGFGGIDLTGVWCPPLNAYDQCAIRQSGAYLNVAAMIGGMMIFAGEGLFDPRTRALAFAGRYANGAPAQVRGQLLPTGLINGVLAVPNPWAVPMTNPLLLQRMQ